MRPKTTNRDLPPRMLRRTRVLKSGKIWVGYYYDGRHENGKQREIPLGTDLNIAKKKWAEFDCVEPPVETGTIGMVFDQYKREILPTKTLGTQRNYIANLKTLREVFGEMNIDEIKPVHVAKYRKLRSEKAPIVANRELALLSSIFNYAREWGYTANENPCRGVKKNKEAPREYYAEDDVWEAVRACACQEMRDTLDLAYLTGQRPSDVTKMRWSDIQGETISVKQNKTKNKLRILLNDGEERTELGKLIDRIRQRPVIGMTIIATLKGEKLSYSMRRSRFDEARAAAASEAEKAGNFDLADRIREFQMRDTRAKTGSDTTLDHATALLGHTNKAITKRVYHRRGEIVKPLK